MRKDFEVDVILKPFADYTRLKCSITVQATKLDGSDASYVWEDLKHADGSNVKVDELDHASLAILDARAMRIAQENGQWAAQEYAEGLAEHRELRKDEDND